MKKLILFSLLLLALGSCNEKKIIPSTVAIYAKAGVMNISSRAPVESDEVGKLPQNDLTIFFARASDAATVNWGTVTGPQVPEEGFAPGIIKGTLIGKHDATNKGKINFHESQYYNADQVKKTWLISYHPEDNDGYENELTTPGTLVWTIDGKKDIMFSSAVSGDKITNNTIPLAFTLSHKLTWLEFKIKSNGQTDNDGDDMVANDAWGKITSIKIKGMTNLYTLALPLTTTFSGSVDMSTWNRSDNTPAAQALTVSPTFFSQALVEPHPYATDRNYTLLITTEKRTTPVEVPISLTGNVQAQAGTKHIITLTFHAVEIATTAEVTPWVDGAPGSGTAE